MSGILRNGEIAETSGVADSRAHPGVLWVHNDSGDSARLFATDASGADLGEYAVPGAGFDDWEDIGSGPGPDPGRSYLYVGDIGDNAATRDHVVVYRVSEPDVRPDGSAGTLSGVEAFEVTYPMGPRDAETLFVDPGNGDVYIVTKGTGTGGDPGIWIVLRVPAPLVPGSRTTAQEVARIDTAQIPMPDQSPLSRWQTSGDVSADGRYVAGVTQKGDLRIWERPAGGALHEAFLAPPCLLAAPADVSEGAEAVGFASDVSAIYKMNETANQGGGGGATSPIPVHRYLIPARAPLDPQTLLPGLPGDGPSALYAPEPALPEPRWPFETAFSRTCGTGRLAGGAFYWTDFLYDDNGAFGVGCGNAESPGAPTGGSYCYPEGTASRNGADIFRIGIGVDATDTWWRVDWNTLVDATVPIAAFGLDTDASELTGAAAWPAGAGVMSAGLDAVLLVSGAGAWLMNPLLATSTPVTSLGGEHIVDLAARSFVVRLPRTALAPIGSWTVRLVSGLADASGQAFAPVDAQHGALPGQPAVYNVGFRTREQEAAAAGASLWFDAGQGQALASGNVSTFKASVEWASLESGTSTAEPLPTGISNRWYVSSLELGQGKVTDSTPPIDVRPNYLGRVQPYAVYVPTAYDGSTPVPLTWILHSYTSNHNQYAGSSPNFVQQACESRGSICAMTLGRGPDMFYLDEAQLDFLEVWNRVADAYVLDPDRTVVSGYSMGGWAGYLLPMAYPDLFSRSVVLAGPPGCGGLELMPGQPMAPAGTSCAALGATAPMLPNVRWLPYYIAHGALDELAPIAATQAQVDAFDALDLRYRFDLYPGEDHVAFLLQDGFVEAAAFMGSSPRSVDPGHVSFVWKPVLARPDLGFAPAGAWWVQSAAPRDAELETASIDAFSLAKPDPEIVEVVRTTTPLPAAQPSPAVRQELDWVLGGTPCAEPFLTLDLGNVGELTLALQRAGLVPEGAVAGDSDGDGIADASDNCPFAPNEAQADRGGIHAEPPDGIGDACQCGDVTGNGVVNGQDGFMIMRHGLGLEPNPPFQVCGNCDVNGDGECNGIDGVAVTREALGLQPNPVFANACPRFTGKKQIDVDTDGASDLALEELVPGTQVALDGVPLGVGDPGGSAAVSIPTGAHQIALTP